MPNVIDHLIPQVALEGTSPIYKLACDLDDFLSAVAFAEEAENTSWIRKRIIHLRKKYHHVAESLGDGWDKANTPLGIAFNRVYEAFRQTCVYADCDGGLIHSSPEERREIAEEILAENMFINCDCYVENQILALRQEGYDIDVQAPVLGLDGLVVAVELKKKQKKRDAEI
ncbi:MAG: hypothetical protein AABX71_02190 [Nanoarchaeota archaeon]